MENLEQLPTRHEEVLKATVHHYVDTIEPVSSKTLVQRFGLAASSATIRSAMGALEQRGYLTQPHTSAGRVPSPQGYRHYVDRLLPPPGCAVQYLEKELTNLSLQWASFDDLLWHLTKRLTDFTGLMSLITKPAGQEPILREIRLVQSRNRLLVMLVDSANHASHLNVRFTYQAAPEIEAIEKWSRQQLSQSSKGVLDWANLPPQLHLSGSILKEAIESHRHAQEKGNAVFHGMSQLISQPEFSNSNEFRPLLELMDTHPTAIIPDKQKKRVWIGSEHPQRALAICSVVQASYKNSDKNVGQVVLVGPMRMAYATAMAAVQSVAKHLERILS